MDEVKNLLAITLVVMAAGSSIYTIKAYMKPGIDLNINLEEIQEDTNMTELFPESNQLVDSFRNFVNTNLLSSTDIDNSTVEMVFFDTHDSRNVSHFKRSLSSKGPKYNKITSSLNSTVVTTSLGKIEGIKLSVIGKTVYAFLGIDYAEAPVNKLRFKRPVPISAWNTSVSAKQWGNSCVQVSSGATGSVSRGSNATEDCLNLNIWTPNTKSAPLLPVLFYVHDGSFAYGSNADDQTDGRILAALHNLVVVSANYRLGPYGFLYLPNKRVTSNLGLSDLAEALRWTRAHVHHFGGDPNLITVLGHSSGAIATALLLTSPETQTLFQRAILQGASSTIFNFYYKQSERSSEEYAQLLGCLKANERLSTSNSDQVWRCIESASAQELQQAARRQTLPYSPTTEAWPVLGTPMDLLEESIRRSVNRKEILLGTGPSSQIDFFANIGYLHLFTKRSPSLKDLEEVRQLLSSSLKNWGISRRTLRLINFFFMNKSIPLDENTLRGAMLDVFGDLSFTCSVQHFAKRFAVNTNHSSYYYHYSNSGLNDANVTKSSELPYVFGHPLRYPDRYTGQDIDFSKQLMNLWASFVRTGRPVLSDNTYWPNYTAENSSYVELKCSEPFVVSSTVYTNYSKINCDTWQQALHVFT